MRIAACASIAVLAGCAASTPDLADSWPSALPSRVYFERAWESDTDNRKLQTCDQYLAWVEAFYAGSLLVPGWERRKRELLAKLDLAQARLADPELASLGQVLASEWAKDNRQRRVSSSMLVLWGRVMNGVGDSRPLVCALDAIRTDLRSLLSGELAPEAVALPRYSALLASQP